MPSPMMEEHPEILSHYGNITHRRNAPMGDIFARYKRYLAGWLCHFGQRFAASQGKEV